MVEKIKLVLINERALTFKADDYIKLRIDHRIMGKLMGACVPYPRNVSINGLPACYTEFQTRFLLENDIVELEIKKDLQNQPTDAIKEAYQEHKNKLMNEIQEPLIEAKMLVVRSKMDSIIKGKKAKMRKMGVPEEDIKITPEIILQQEEEKLRETLTTSNPSFTQIPTQHPFQLPSTLLKEFPVFCMTKYKVFCDLWQKGFYITNGESFGGDFLTYPDDPIYYHASQIVHVVDANHKFELYFPISCSRLAVSVKKKCVFAYLDDDGKVVYQTMFWDNPKLKEIYVNEKRKRKKVDEDVHEMKNGENSNEVDESQEKEEDEVSSGDEVEVKEDNEDL
jgi:tRNA-splicing endonuclease subunit Sen34